MGIFSSKETKIKNAKKFLREHNQVSVLDLGILDAYRYHNATETLGKYNIPYRHPITGLETDKALKRK